MNKLPQILLLVMMLTANFFSNHALSNGADRQSLPEKKRGQRDNNSSQKSQLIRKIKNQATSRPKPKTRDSALPPTTSTPARASSANVNPIHSTEPEPTTGRTSNATLSESAMPTADLAPTSSVSTATNSDSTKPTTMFDAAGSPIEAISRASEQTRTSETSQVIPEPQEKTSEPSSINSPVPVQNIIVDTLSSSANNEPVNPSPVGNSDLKIQINELTRTDADIQNNIFNTSYITTDNSNIMTETPINPPSAPSIGGGSLIGSTLPSSVNIPSYPKTNYDPRFYVVNQLIVFSENMPQAKKVALVLGQYQARVIRRIKLTDLNFVLSTFRLPKQVSVKQVIEKIRRAHPDILIEPNHYFLPQSKSASKELNNRNEVFNKINKPIDHMCGQKLKIGMLDGPIDISHVSLKNQNIIQKSFYAKGEKLANESHATAIASLLVGDPNVMGLAGVVDKATLFSGNVMQQHPKNKNAMLATTESIILGLNWLVKQKVDVINLSLGGKSNLLLAKALEKVIDNKIFVVASAGNSGPTSAPSYPAAMINIISVTSIDHRGKIATDANQGSYIDIAAPGVDLWVAGKNNSGRYSSGTSIAAPLVTAAIALLVQKKQSIDILFEEAIDLGKSGKDSVFGHGLLQFPSCSD